MLNGFWYNDNYMNRRNRSVCVCVLLNLHKVVGSPEPIPGDLTHKVGTLWRGIQPTAGHNHTHINTHVHCLMQEGSTAIWYIHIKSSIQSFSFFRLKLSRRQSSCPLGKLQLWCILPGTIEYPHSLQRPISCGNYKLRKRQTQIKRFGARAFTVFLFKAYI